jgi:Xaa-Pro aminopeptidase
LEAGGKNLFPGRRVRDIVASVMKEVRRNGLKTGKWCGHGMGTDLGDGIGLLENNDLELKESMVLTIHPHVMSPDAKEGLFLGDTYAVTTDGGKNRSRTQCELRNVGW